MNPRRVLLKLSGEALAGPNKTGFDEATVKEVARQVKISVDAGVEVGIVIGGGNFWRGRTSNAIDRTKADQIGMLATVMNCIYVSEIFRCAGMTTQILTPFECGSMTVPAILTFLPIPESRFGPSRWKRTASFWRRPSTAFTTAIRRSIRRRRSMMRFPYRRSLTSSWA